MAELSGLILRNKLRKDILGDDLFRALLHERREPAERPHTEYVRRQKRTLWIQARLVIRLGTELWAQALESKRKDAECTDAPPQCRDRWAAGFPNIKGSAGPDQERGYIGQPEYQCDGGGPPGASMIEVGEQWENEKCSNFQDKRREEIDVLGMSNGDAEIDDGS